MKKAFITGIGGFVGGYLTEELARNDYKVYGTDRIESKSELAEVFAIDILDKVSLKELLLKIKPDVIFHLAALTKPGESFNKEAETIEVNVEGSKNLLDVVSDIENYDPRFVMIGSSEEYGKINESDLPISENYPRNPLSPYAKSKAAVYELCKNYVKEFKLDIVYAVPFPHIGPRQREGFIVPDMCVQIVAMERGERESVLMTGNLDTIRDYTDVRDMVRGYRLLFEQGVKGERYNLCSGKGTKIEDVVNSLVSFSQIKIERKLDESRLRPAEVPVIFGSNEKVNKLCGWEPSIPINQTLMDTLEWWRSK